MKRIRGISWWHWLFLVVFPLAATVYVAFNASLVTLIIVVSGVAAVEVGAWGLFTPRPHPQLVLRPDGQTAATSVVLGAQWRPVDVDAVVDTARQTVRSPGLNTLRMFGGWVNKPTEKDLDTFRSEVDDYLTEMKNWAEQSEAWLGTNSSVLEVHVFQENDSDVDAEEAKVTIVFPEGTKPCEPGELEPPQEPERPQLKTSPGPLMQALRPWGGAPSAFYGDRPALDFSMEKVEPYSMDEPDFHTTSTGLLEVTYRRQPIRHRELLPSGDPFAVRLPPGQHEITWRITAKNLPHPKTGSWTVNCPSGPSGKTIESLGSLQAAIAGEPELDIEEMFASKRTDLGESSEKEA